MDLQLLVLLAAIFAIGGFLYFQLKKTQKPASDTNLNLLTEQFNQRMIQMQQQMMQMQGSLDKNIGTFQEQISSTNRSINERLEKASDVMTQVSKNLGEMSEIGRTMQDFQSLLRSPKLRGGVGEFILQDLLEQTMPQGSFFLQHPFKNGFIVDAAVKLDKGIISIDAKFPSENFKKMVDSRSDLEHDTAKKDFERDVKRHIDDIAKKYICPDEGTLEFAVMYVPSEPIYQEIVCNEAIMDFAHKKGIWPVSPNTFLYFLKLILFGMQGQKMEEQTKQIMQLFKTLQIEQEKLAENLLLVAKHARNTTNAADEALRRQEHISMKIANTKILEVKAPKENAGDKPQPNFFPPSVDGLS